jgi:hypothetical protein
MNPAFYPEPGVGALRSRIVSVALRTSNPIGHHRSNKDMLPVIPWPVQE